jgi:hypothetical protein
LWEEVLGEESEGVEDRVGLPLLLAKGMSARGEKELGVASWKRMLVGED